MKRFYFLLYILCGLFMVTTSCVDDMEQNHVSSSDIVKLNFCTVIPDVVEVNTRSVDQDGWGIQSLWVFCFDASGNYIGRSLATMQGDVQDATREFSVEVSNQTCTVHLLGNQYLDDFQDAQYIGVHENTVMTGLVSTSNKITYWGRVTAGSNEALKTAFTTATQSSPIPMYRNQAWISYQYAEGITDNIAGYAICNVYANGTSVPFNSATQQFDWLTDKPFITTPATRLKATDPEDVDTEANKYIFETPNTGEDEIYLIFKDDGGKYYKVSVCDENKDPLPIYRNYHYIINFTEQPKEQYGADTFEAAKQLAPLNNTWVAIDASIPSIGNDQVGTLTVDETSVIYTTGGEQTLNYTYTAGTSSSGQTPVVTWVSNDGVAAETFDNNYSNGEGSITIQVNQAEEGEVLRGELQIKVGALVRYIKVYSIVTYTFLPTWCTTGVYNGAAEQDVAFIFTIPDTYPEELLPVRCLITTTLLHSNGVVPLSVIMAGDENFGAGQDESGNTIDYKYVYEAEETGTHRIYFHTNYAVTETEGSIMLEAENFTTRTTKFTFSGNTGHQMKITNARTYTGDTGATDNTEVYYLIEPRKKGEEITFNLRYDNNLNLPAGVKIRVFTENLKPKDNTGFTEGTSDIGAGSYWEYTTTEGEDNLVFVTTKADFDETIRFSTPYESEGDALYKSCVLELSSYRAWDFNPSVAPVAYGTGQTVNLSFDVKAFTSSVETDEVSVDPGEGFYCYIKTDNLLPTASETCLEAFEEGYKYLVSNSDKDANGRITLHFETSKIVSAETIGIYTDRNIIDFNDAEVKLTNTPLTGSIKYGDLTDVPQNAFVTMERKDGTRIGAVTITENGKYSITLRGEYTFGWEETIYIKYKVENMSYETSTTLKYLSTEEQIVLNATD